MDLNNGEAQQQNSSDPENYLGLAMKQQVQNDTISRHKHVKYLEIHSRKNHEKG